MCIEGLCSSAAVCLFLAAVGVALCRPICTAITHSQLLGFSLLYAGRVTGVSPKLNKSAQLEPANSYLGVECFGGDNCGLFNSVFNLRGSLFTFKEHILSGKLKNGKLSEVTRVTKSDF